MFKSLFTKITVVFMLIILISFGVLSITITSIANDYAQSLKKEGVAKAAEMVSEYIKRSFNGNSPDDFASYVEKNKYQLRSALGLALYYSDTNVFLVDTDGDALCSDLYASPDIITGKIKGSVIDKLFSGLKVTDVSDLDGALNKEYLYTAIPIMYNDNIYVGSVFAFSESVQSSGLISELLKTIILSTMWIMIAMLIAIYFISERLIGPLRSMRKAAKEFAVGHYDARVDVVGHDEVAELANSFNNMAESIEKNEMMRRTFLANVSHDLRTPMTTISGFIDGIIEGVIPKDKHNYYLSVVASEVRRLSRLVNSLLDITRIQAGERRFEMKEFDVCEMARRILITFEQKIEEKKLDVEFDCDEDHMYAVADSDAIHQILYNISDNAVKFSKDKGRLKIALKYNDKKITVSVYNEGEGISKEDLPYVFDRFYKADKSRGLDKTGVGLGMYISKTIIEAHGEKIWAQSESGEDCEFSFTLKRAK